MIAPNAKQKLDELSSRVLAASADALKKERCPDCGGRLLVSFHAGRRGVGSVSIDCRSCEIRIRLDGLLSVPLWASDPGRLGET
jgi:hypothetical protein